MAKKKVSKLRRQIRLLAMLETRHEKGDPSAGAKRLKVLKRIGQMVAKRDRRIVRRRRSV